MAVRKFPLRRGIDPGPLIELVKNTAPFLFAEEPRTPYIRRLVEYDGAELSHLDYFHLALCAHWATAGTFVPTDVDSAIRFKLWQMDEADGMRSAMADLTIAAVKWDYTPVTTRTAAGGRLATHEGTWFSVAVGAYAALRTEDPKKAAEVLETMWTEAVREDAVFSEVVASGDGLEILRACALIAHNFGDLDRVVDMWHLPADDALRLRLYDLAKPGTKAFGGRLGWAGLLNQKFMATENHRYFALREPRFLRQKRALLLPVGPFLDGWGSLVAKEKAEDVGECVSAILYGVYRTPGSIAYIRALAGILEAFPGGMTKLCQYIPGKDERTLKTGSVRAQMSVPRDRFEAGWARYWRQIPKP